MLKPKQLFIIIYVNVFMKRVYPHKTNSSILFRYENIPESQFSVPWSSLRFRNVNHLRAIIVLSTKVNNLSFWKFRIFTRVSMPREWAVGMVQAIMTHHAVADHFNVSIIIIVRLMIHLRQTGSTNDRLRNDRPCVTSQRQDRHLRLIHLRNCRTTGLPNNRI